MVTRIVLMTAVLAWYMDGTVATPSSFIWSLQTGDFIHRDHALQSVQAQTAALACARECVKMEGCVTFTYWPLSPASCTFHAGNTNVLTGSEMASGASLYTLVGKTVAETTAQSSATPPTVQSSTTEATIQSSTTPPTVESSTTQSTVQSSTTQPSVQSSTIQPSVQSSTTQLSVQSSTTQPSVQSSTTQGTVQSSTTQPTAQSSSTTPTTQSSSATLADNRIAPYVAALGTDSGTVVGANFVMFKDSAKTGWNVARQHCEAAGLKLAKLDQAAHNYITSLMSETWFQSGVTVDFWVGLFDSNTGDTSDSNSGYSWVADCALLSDGNWARWRSGEPENTVSNFCVGLDKSSHEWRSLPCDSLLQFLCYTPKTVCDNDNTGYNSATETHTETCYSFQFNSTSYPDDRGSTTPSVTCPGV